MEMKIKHSESLSNLGTAMVACQSVVRGALKSSANPHFKSKFADLEEVWSVAREPLADNGLCIIQCPVEAGDDRAGLTTLLLHKSGEWVESTFSVKLVKNDPQGAGAAITYMRRYTLMAVVGIAPEDDDGNYASGHTKEMHNVKANLKSTEASHSRNGNSSHSAIGNGFETSSDIVQSSKPRPTQSNANTSTSSSGPTNVSLIEDVASAKAEILSHKSTASLASLAARFKKLPDGPAKDEISAAFKAHRAKLQSQENA